MARYKPIHTGLKLLPVDFDQQVIPGSFEHALCYMVDHELDLTAFHARYKVGVGSCIVHDGNDSVYSVLTAPAHT
jgi:hypothetical protein